MAGNLYGNEYRDLVNRARAQGIQGAGDLPSTFAENVAAAFESFQFEDLSTSEGENWMRETTRQFRLAESLMGGIPPEQVASRFQPVLIDRQGFPRGVRQNSLGLVQGEPGIIAIDWFERNQDRIAELKKQFPDAGFMTAEELKAKIAADAARLRARRDDVASRADGWGLAGQFVGSMGAVLTDPVNIVAMAAEAPIALARSGNLLVRTLKAGGVGVGFSAGSEALIQPFVYQYKQGIGSEYTVGDAFANIGYAAAGGAVFSGAVPPVAAAFGKVKGGYRRLVERYRKAVEDGDVIPTPDTEVAAQAIEDAAEIFERSPYRSDDPAGQERHIQAYNKAVEDVSNGQAADVGRILGEDPAPPVGLESLDPQSIEVDAARFQFKQGGDEFGVSERLQGVERFDPTLAGVSIVWENAGGRRFIVDGHQRLGLARRAIAAGQDPAEVRINTIVLREADGVSDAMARKVAAVKNIAEGTGTALDAAKVLRETGGDLADLPPLPPRSALVRDAQGLAKLSDEAFQAAVNEVVDQRFAALVGQSFSDPAEQMAAIRVLAQAEPANVTQAQAMIDQVKAAGFQRETTADLFGEQEVASSLFKERARVLDHAMRRLRKDRQTFRTLVDRENEIAGAGNILDAQANAERLGADNLAMAQLSRTANTAGPISDALNEAAQRLKAGEPIRKVVDEFMRVVRDDAGVSTPKAPEFKVGKPIKLNDVPNDLRKSVEDALIEKQIGRDWDDVYAVAQQWQDELGEIGKGIADDLDGVEFSNPGIKVRKTAEGRAIDKGKKPGEMKDIVRAGFLVSKPSDGDAIVTGLGKRLEVLDEDWFVTPDGYFDRKVAVRFDDGTVGEIQIWEPNVLEAKEKGGGHKMYEKRRKMVVTINGVEVAKPGMEKAARVLREEMQALYSGALKDSAPEWRGLYAADTFSPGSGGKVSGASASSSENIASNLSRESGRAESVTSAGLTDVQTPGSDRVITNAASPPDGVVTTTAGRPSQSAKISTSSNEAIGVSSVTDDIVADDSLYTKDAERILQENPDLEVPVGVRMEDGAPVVETRPLKEIIDEIDEDAGKIDDLFTCWDK